MIQVNGTKKSCVYTLCATRPCHRGTCVAQSPSKFTCHCPEGYRGRHCETTLAVYRDDVGLSFSSLFAICICFMALLGRLSTYWDTYLRFGTWDTYEYTFTFAKAGKPGIWELLPPPGPGFTQFLLWSVQVLNICIKMDFVRRNIHSREAICLQTNCRFQIAWTETGRGGMAAVKGQWLPSN